MPLMILGHLQNAGHCYSAFSHGLQDIGCEAIDASAHKFTRFDCRFGDVRIAELCALRFLGRESRFRAGRNQGALFSASAA
jgi:hypothetical protein